MLIDCETCTAPEHACEDCVVAVLLRRPSDAVTEFDADDRAALDTLADAGLVPPLRLVPVYALPGGGRSTSRSAGLPARRQHSA